ncbi:hypothetical protein B0O99DRAFT_722272 [Bisporella sp. PMI_857]|nr:hypothetical protein B0O99DRAFT_722272 [Bisporella sp. PMI_857]
MVSLIPAQIIKSPKSQVVLIPWDPSSPEHVKRMLQQRMACGWDKDVEGWKAAQQNGELNLQWILLKDSDPEKDGKLLKHVQTYPLEEEPLADSALFFRGKSRTIPLPQRTFIPVGHICLGRVPAEYEISGFAKNEKGLYWISKFYISRALQGSGLGRAAMDTIENLATSEPLCAKTLTLNAITKEVPDDRDEKYKALGQPIPPFSNQEWYTSRGYQIYCSAERLFSSVDSTGKTWYFDAVFLKKDI